MSSSSNTVVQQDSGASKTTTTAHQKKAYSAVGDAIMQFNDAYEPYLRNIFKTQYGNEWETQIKQLLHDSRMDVVNSFKGIQKPQSSALRFETHIILFLLTRLWNDLFSKVKQLNDPQEYVNARTLFFEAKSIRNMWAHQCDFTFQDAYRAVDTLQRLCSIIDASAQVAKLEKIRRYCLEKMFKELHSTPSPPPSADAVVASVSSASVQPSQQQQQFANNNSPAPFGNNGFVGFNSSNQSISNVNFAQPQAFNMSNNNSQQFMNEDQRQQYYKYVAWQQQQQQQQMLQAQHAQLPQQPQQPQPQQTVPPQNSSSYGDTRQYGNIKITYLTGKQQQHANPEDDMEDF